MILKTVGAVIVIGIGIFSAFCSAKYDRLKLSVLDHWLALLSDIRNEISCYLKPMSQILAQTDRHLIQGLCCTEKEPDLDELLRSSSAFLSEESRQILADFASHAGQGYKEEQIKQCERTESLLIAERDRTAGSLPGKIKLHVTLCLCASFGAAILLW